MTWRWSLGVRHKLSCFWAQNYLGWKFVELVVVLIEVFCDASCVLTQETFAAKIRREILNSQWCYKAFVLRRALYTSHYALPERRKQSDWFSSQFAAKKNRGRKWKLLAITIIMYSPENTFDALIEILDFFSNSLLIPSKKIWSLLCSTLRWIASRCFNSLAFLPPDRKRYMSWQECIQYFHSRQYRLLNISRYFLRKTCKWRIEFREQQAAKDTTYDTIRYTKSVVIRNGNKNQIECWGVASAEALHDSLF